MAARRRRPQTPAETTQVFAGAGIGLREPHYAALLQRKPPLALVEMHSENHFGLGGVPLEILLRAREHYPLSLHGVGLSLGSAGALSLGHLARLRALVERVQPALVSEHLSWNAVPGMHLHDLLPMPFTEEAIEVLVSHIGQVQDTLRRTLLVENVSSYVSFAADQMSEWEFVGAVVRRAGCQLLLDINNLYVNAHNQGFDAQGYLAALAPESVGEFHLAGHSVRDSAYGPVLLDTHDGPVAAPVWALFGEALARFGARPTLIEWDGQLPELDVLLAQASKAQRLIDALASSP